MPIGWFCCVCGFSSFGVKGFDDAANLVVKCWNCQDWWVPKKEREKSNVK